MKIEFLMNRKVDAAGGESYRAGQVIDVPESSAAHWISRGVAKRWEKPTKRRPSAARNALIESADADVNAATESDDSAD